MDCKITNSNRRNLNLKPKRLYFNDFKDLFIHFNGTVVIIFNLIFLLFLQVFLLQYNLKAHYESQHYLLLQLRYHL